MHFALICFTYVLLVLTNAHATSVNFQKYTITAPGIKASFIGYGARLTNLLVHDKNGKMQDVVLGYDDPLHYVHDTENEHTYFGAVAGRYANRMRNGTFTVDGFTSHVTENDHQGHDSLHGGIVGYDQRNWTVISHSESTITFMLYDHGFEGYPGNVITYATYTVTAGPSWIYRLVSIPLDEQTPLMVITHPYWNLNAFVDPSNPTILSDTLHMPYSRRYIEIDNIEVPTGKLATVSGTPLDFTSPKTFGQDIFKPTDIIACGYNCTGYDNSFIIDRPRYSGLESTDENVLTMYSNLTGIRMDLYTNQQTLLIYTCNQLNGTIPVKSSQQHGSETLLVPEHGCVAIETQGWIDGINHPEWGQDTYQIYSNATQPAVVWARYDWSIVGS